MSKVSRKLDLVQANIFLPLANLPVQSMSMNERIVGFLNGQKVACVCCVDDEGRPYCFSCFYAFDSERQLIYFKSGSGAHHSQLLLNHSSVAGTIQPDKLNPLAIKGIQFTGRILPAHDERCAHAAASYHKKYPFALAMPGEVWTLQLETLKMTDNTLSFGKKLHWQLAQVVD